jgi:hypothetical protein
MGRTLDPAGIKALASKHLSQGQFVNNHIRRTATVAEPRLVVGPRGEPHSWLVGLTAGTRLAALFQILLDGTIMRYSSFQRRPGDLTGCPPARDWLDPVSARDRAASHAHPDDEVETPVLTFDRSPDRLVWAVPVRRSDGRRHTVYVAGSSVYDPPDSSTFG